jgi:hypothetical protein
MCWPNLYSSCVVSVSVSLRAREESFRKRFATFVLTRRHVGWAPPWSPCFSCGRARTLCVVCENERDVRVRERERAKGMMRWKRIGERKAARGASSSSNHASIVAAPTQLHTITIKHNTTIIKSHRATTAHVKASSPKCAPSLCSLLLETPLSLPLSRTPNKHQSQQRRIPSSARSHQPGLTLCNKRR